MRDCHFVIINCSKHYAHCRNVDFSRLPMGMVQLPADFKYLERVKKYTLDGEYPEIEYAKDFKAEAIEQFLIENHILRGESYKVFDNLI